MMILLAVGIPIVLFHVVLMNLYIPSESMEPLLTKGMRLIATRFDRTEIRRGDIVVFCDEYDLTYHYIKRVVGMPGETVEIRKGHVYIGGCLFQEDYLKEDMEPAEEQVFHVPEDAYLMLGDNRNNSFDSREWDSPYVDAVRIEGKARFIYWPINKVGVL